MALQMEDLQKIAEMVATMTQSGRKEKEKASKALGRDIVKNIGAYDGNCENYNEWSFKVKMAVKAVEEKAFEVLEKVENEPMDSNITKMERVFKTEDGYDVQK